MRVLVIGDSHLHEGDNLDDVTQCLLYAVQVAEKQEPDLVVFLGDQFDRKSTPAERLVLRDVLLSLPCRSLLIRGNHETLGDLKVFEGYPDVWVYEQPAVVELPDADVLVMPWPDKAHLAAQGLTGEAGDQAGGHILGNLMRGLAATRKNPLKPLLLFGHLAVGGAVSSSGQPLIGRSLEVSLGDLADVGACVTCLGHIHKPQELASGITYAGSLSITDFGEEGEEKRIGLLDVTSGGVVSLTWIPVPCRRWHTVEASVEAGILVENCDAFCGQVNPPDFANANLRYRYTTTEADDHLFDHAEIRRRFAAAHSLKIVPQVERSARVRAADVAAARTAEEKLRAWGTATETEITPALVEKLHSLESEEAR